MTKLRYQHFAPDGLRDNKKVSNSSRLILLEAERHGVKWEIVPGTQVVILEYKGRQVSYYHQVPSTTSALAKYSCNNKKITRNLLTNAGVVVPKGFQVSKRSSAEYLREVYDDLKKPLVVKPVNGYAGESITVEIDSYPSYLQALELAFAYSSKDSTALVEEMFEGEEYRILATRDKVIGIVHRVPGNVVGDGVHTIRQLIEQKNAEEIREENGLQSHLQIKIDKDLHQNLAELGLNLDTIPEVDEQVFLRKVSNISKGGDAIDYTDLAHPSVKEIVLEAIRAIPGLSFAGVDLITSDITQQQTNDSYVIIEINDSPGFDIHDYPYEGTNRHAAREFLYLLYPELKKPVTSRFPRKYTRSRLVI